MDVFGPVAEALAVFAGASAAACEEGEFPVGFGGGEDLLDVDVVEPVVALERGDMSMYGDSME